MSLTAKKWKILKLDSDFEVREYSVPALANGALALHRGNGSKWIISHQSGMKVCESFDFSTLKEFVAEYGESIFCGDYLEPMLFKKALKEKGLTYKKPTDIAWRGAFEQLLAAISDKKKNQKDIAHFYFLVLRIDSLSSVNPEWELINKSILSRYKPSGLKRIKELAHQEYKRRFPDEYKRLWEF